jgi:ankyrin repeat protein
MKDLFKLIKDVQFGEDKDKALAEFIQRVNSGEDIDIETNWNTCLISETASVGNLEAFNCLIENGAKVESDDRVMSLAAYSGNIEIVKILMDKNIKIDYFALHHAAREGYIDIVKLFIDSGVDVNHQEDIVVEGMTDIKTKSDTLLSSAASSIYSYDDEQMTSNKIEVIKYLLDSGADINLHGKFGNTALHWSATDINLEIVSLLVENGADKKAKNDGGKRAFSYADPKDKEVKALIK